MESHAKETRRKKFFLLGQDSNSEFTPVNSGPGLDINRADTLRVTFTPPRILLVCRDYQKYLHQQAIHSRTKPFAYFLYPLRFDSVTQK